jgi:hypothetical protein
MLQQELSNVVEECRSSDEGPQIRLKEARDDGCHTFVLAALARATNAAVRLRSYDTLYSDALPVTIQEAARATAAAGHIVLPVKIGKDLFVGGDINLCNPTWEAIEETRDIWGKRSISIVVSIGAGLDSGHTQLDGPFREYISECNHAAELAHQDVGNQFKRKYLEGEYFRLSGANLGPLGPSIFGINEHERSKAIQEDTELYMHYQRASNQKIASLLLAQPGIFPSVDPALSLSTTDQPINRNDRRSDENVPTDVSGDTKVVFPYGLEVLHESKTPPKYPVQIVFVHGLNGSKRGTWTSSKKCFWPGWLPQEKGLEEVRIATFGYNSSPNILKPNTNLSIPIFANQLLFYLNQLSYEHRSVRTVIEIKLTIGIHYFRSA